MSEKEKQKRQKEIDFDEWDNFRGVEKDDEDIFQSFEKSKGSIFESKSDEEQEKQALQEENPFDISEVKSKKEEGQNIENMEIDDFEKNSSNENSLFKSVNQKWSDENRSQGNEKKKIEEEEEKGKSKVQQENEDLSILGIEEKMKGGEGKNENKTNPFAKAPSQEKVKKESIDSNMQKSGKEDVNFSMFGSVKSNGSNASKVSKPKSKAQEPIDFQDYPQNEHQKGEAKKGEDVNFSMFASMKSNPSKQHQQSKRSFDFNEFSGKQSEEKKASIQSQANPDKQPKQEINFSMFGSVKSNMSNVESQPAGYDPFAKAPSQEKVKKESIDSNMQKSGKEDVNFSMFGSMKSNGSNASKVSKPKSKAQEPIDFQDYPQNEHQKGEAKKGEDVNFSMFASMKSNPSKQHQQSKRSFDFNEFSGKQSEEKKASIQSQANPDKQPKQEINFSMFGSVKSNMSNVESQPAGYDPFAKAPSQEKVKKESIDSNMQKSGKEDVNFSMFGSVKSNMSNVESQPAGYDPFAKAPSQEKVKKESIDSNMQKSGKEDVNFSMFGSMKSNGSNASKVSKPKSKAQEPIDFQDYPQNEHQKGEAKKGEDVNFSMFASMKSNPSKQHQQSKRSFDFNEFSGKQSEEKKASIQSQANPDKQPKQEINFSMFGSVKSNMSNVESQPAGYDPFAKAPSQEKVKKESIDSNMQKSGKEDVNFSMFGSVKSNMSNVESQPAGYDPFAKAPSQEKVKKESIDSNMQKSGKEDVNFSMFGSMKSNGSNASKVSKPKSKAQEPIDFQDYPQNEHQKGEAKKGEDVNFSMFASMKSNPSKQHQQSKRSFDFNEFSGKQSEEKKASIQSQANPDKQPKQEINFSMFGSVKSNMSNVESQPAGYDPFAKAPSQEKVKKESIDSNMQKSGKEDVNFSMFGSVKSNMSNVESQPAGYDPFVKAPSQEKVKKESIDSNMQKSGKEDVNFSMFGSMKSNGSNASKVSKPKSKAQEPIDFQDYPQNEHQKGEAKKGEDVNFSMFASMKSNPSKQHQQSKRSFDFNEFSGKQSEEKKASIQSQANPDKQPKQEINFSMFGSVKSNMSNVESQPAGYDPFAKAPSQEKVKKESIDSNMQKSGKEDVNFSMFGSVKSNMSNVESQPAGYDPFAKAPSQEKVKKESIDSNMQKSGKEDVNFSMFGSMKSNGSNASKVSKPKSKAQEPIDFQDYPQNEHQKGEAKKGEDVNFSMFASMKSNPSKQHQQSKRSFDFNEFSGKQSEEKKASIQSQANPDKQPKQEINFSMFGSVKSNMSNVESQPAGYDPFAKAPSQEKVKKESIDSNMQKSGKEDVNFSMFGSVKSNMSNVESQPAGYDPFAKAPSQEKVKKESIDSNMQKSGKEDVNFSMFGSVKSNMSNVESQPAGYDPFAKAPSQEKVKKESIDSNMQKSGKEDVNFSMFGSVKSNMSNVESQPAGYDPFAKAPSQEKVKKESIDSNMQKSGKEDVNFSMFGSMKSNGSNASKVSKPKSKAQEPIDFQDYPQNEHQKGEAKKGEDVNFSMFASMKSNPSKQHQQSKRSFDFNEFSGKQSEEKKASIQSQANPDKQPKQEINFSMFGSVKSNMSNVESQPAGYDPFAKAPSQEKVKKESIDSNMQKSGKEDVNFSMFGSVKSNMSNVESQPAGYDPFAKAPSQEKVKKESIDSNMQKSGKEDVNFSMFGSMKSNGSNASKVSKPKSKAQEPIDFQDYPQNEHQKGEAKKGEDVNFSMFASMKSNPSKQHQQSKRSFDFNEFSGKQSEEKKASIQSQANPDKQPKQEINFSMFGSVKSNMSNVESQPAGYDPFAKAPSQEKVKKESIDSNMQKSGKEDVNFSMFGSVKSNMSNVESQPAGYDPFAKAPSQEKVKKESIDSNMQKSGKEDVNFSMFGSMKSNGSNASKVSKPKSKAQEPIDFQDYPQNEHQKGEAKKGEDVNFSMFASMKSNPSKQHQQSKRSFDFNEFSGKQSEEKKASIQSQANPDKQPKQEINFSMFGSVKSNMSNVESQPAGYDPFAKAPSQEKVKKESIDSNMQKSGKEDVNFSMFGSMKSNGSNASKVSKPKSKAQEPIDFQDYPQNEHQKGEAKKGEDVNFSMFASMKSNPSKQHQQSKRSFDFNEFSGKQSEEKKASIQSQANPDKQPKQEINFSMFGSVKSNMSNVESQPAGYDPFAKAPSQEKVKKESIDSNMQKSGKEDVNFSMFGSMKSHSSNHNSLTSIQIPLQSTLNKPIISPSPINQHIPLSISPSSVNQFNHPSFIPSALDPIHTNSQPKPSSSHQQFQSPSHSNDIRFSQFQSYQPSQNLTQQYNFQKQSSLPRNPPDELPHKSPSEHSFNINQLPSLHQSSHSKSGTSKHSSFVFLHHKQKYHQQQNDLPCNHSNQLRQFQSKVQEYAPDNFIQKERQQNQVSSNFKAQPSQIPQKYDKFYKELPRNVHAYNQLYEKILLQDKQLKKIQQTSAYFVKQEKNTLTHLLKELSSIRKDLYDLSHIEQSSDDSYINDSDVNSIMRGLNSYREGEKQKMLYLFQKLQKIEHLVVEFVKHLNQKKNEIKNDPFYNIKSPLSMTSCFAKQKQQRKQEQSVFSSSPPEEIHTNYTKFYINKKFFNNNSYKKLFAPKNIISHTSSFISINFDYLFENSSLRKVLRVTMSIKNISSSIITHLSVETQTLKNVIAVNPSKIYMEDFRPEEVLHQIIYFSEYDPENSFLPIKISYSTQTKVNKVVQIPLAIDISKFLLKEKVKPNSQLSYRSDETFTLKSKSEFTFYGCGENRLTRFNLLNDLEKIQIREDLCQQGYNMTVLSTNSLQTSRIKQLIEFMKFMYD